MKLSTLCVLLGLGVALPQVYALLKPAACREAMQKFPRSKAWGCALVALGTVWFLLLLKEESIADFTPYKPYMYVGFASLGVLTCLFVSDLLAMRGVAIVLLLLAKLMLDTQRWVKSDWRLVIAVWAYALAVAGMWFTISPWRLRDLINWATANEKRLRLLSSLRLAFGLFIVVLGLHFRSGEQKDQTRTGLRLPTTACASTDPASA
jgi:hypothetical protein